MKSYLSLGMRLLWMAAIWPLPGARADVSSEALAAHYPFNGNANDSSGNGHDGVVSGPSAIGGTNGAFMFDGVDDQVTMTGIALTNSGDFTISFWESAQAQSRLHAVSLGNTEGANLDFDFNDGGGIWVYWNGGGGLAIQAGATGEFTDGAWHHILFRRQGAAVELYIDGTNRGSSVQAGAIGSPSPLNIGKSSASSYWWRGMIDEVRVYNRALSAAEIVTLAIPAERPTPPAPLWSWTSVRPSAPFAARDGAGALTFNGRMWLIGGWNPGDKGNFPRVCNNEVWTSRDGYAWDTAHSNTFLDASFDPVSDWEGRHTAGYVVFQDRMWIVGGDGSQGHYQNNVWNSANGTNWTLVTTNVPWENRVLQHVVAFDGKIWLMGGQKLPQFISDGPKDEAFYNDVWSSTNGIDWTCVLEHAPWDPRGMIGGNIVFSNRIWILGGGTYDTPLQPARKFFNDVWSSADGVNWQCHTANAGWLPRQYHDVAVFDGRMWVLEGWNQKNLNDVWYSADGVSWLELPGTPWAPRHAASVFVHDNALWMVAGNNMQPDVWKLVKAAAVPAGFILSVK